MYLFVQVDFNMFARHVHYRVRYRVLFVFLIVRSHEKHNLSDELDL